MMLQLVEDGVMSRDDYEKYKNVEYFSTKENLGYALVTYSYSVISPKFQLLL